ncbi:thioesterase II family protein [Amycolatopsis australiensis]|uniref:Thioesterase domain-containing protein n=1 Tax=Amycolatopsis australiensis TaxID=546364 RepID=A0A1K1S3P2_9PSEU|nr:thioesterase domain-containing protein [Amycolatopsis australiensis]SFW78708.1 Thioesterase domain-containing protein [Amycolatopsis australiensis]
MHSRSPHTLIAFHHAGGSAATFLPWRKALAPLVRLVPATWPRHSGYACRTDEETELLVSRISAQIGPLTSAPYSVYGHSMGATVGLAVSLYRLGHGLTAPRELLVGAAAAPDAPIDGSIVRLIAGSGRPAAGSSVAELNRRRLTDDLRILDALRRYCVRVLREPAGFPIHVFTGTRDPLCHPAAAQRWSRYTTDICTAETVDGDHYFHRDPGFVRRITEFFAEPAALAR